MKQCMAHAAASACHTMLKLGHAAACAAGLYVSCDCALQVEDFAKQFPTIGFDKADMRYQEDITSDEAATA